ncbi:MAG: hypothetical protein JF606_14205 [Burkholderiales bacterium]|jgi:hypothetical protein|nr:hypothetical protein [Burkholderiales bacterium]
MLELFERSANDDFAQIARHPDFPNAFTRSRKLPLPALIGALLDAKSVAAGHARWLLRFGVWH